MKYVRWTLLTLLALVSAGAATLFIMGLGKDSGSMTNRIEINRPVTQVWSYIDDLDKTKKWVSSLKEIKKLTPGNKGVGAKEVWVMEDQNNGGQTMEIFSEVTAIEPYKFVSVNLDDKKSFTGTASYRFEELGPNRTELIVSGSYEFKDGVANFLKPVIMRMAAGKMQGDLARLKANAERE